MEHCKGLLDVLFAEDVGELSVNLHVKEDIFAVKACRDGRKWVLLLNILDREDPLEHIVKLNCALPIEELNAVSLLFSFSA